MRVLLLGDSVRLTTGFGRVTSVIADHLVSAGADVHQICGLDVPPWCDSKPLLDRGITPYFPEPSDPTGGTAIPHVAERIRPDAIFAMGDPGTVRNWFLRMQQNDVRVPVVMYSPVEGAPIPVTNLEVFNSAEATATCTMWGAEQISAQTHGAVEVPWFYHGVDPAVYFPRSDTERHAIRQSLGWGGKFVVMYVARNNGRKGHDRLIKAMAFLKEWGYADVLLYLHCSPYERHMLQGWDLSALARYCQVAEMVRFPGSFDGSSMGSEFELAKRYAAADLYASASKVEGFGLPLVEAMASGLPVVIPADGGNQQEVVGTAAIAVVKPIDWDTWFNGAQLACVAPEHLARAIQMCVEQPSAAATASERSLERSKDFRWGPLCSWVEEALVRVSAGGAVERELEPVP